jgi:hypothetical protein
MFSKHLNDSQIPISYPKNLTDKVISMRKQKDNKSLGRMLLANSYSNDLILRKMGYNPDELRKIFYDLYMNDSFTKFNSDLFYDIHQDINEKNILEKNILEKLLLEQFGIIPTGYISEYERTSLTCDVIMDSIYLEKISVIFILNTTEKIKFVKAVISVEVVNCNEGYDQYDRLFKEVRFEEITGREAIDSIPGIGHVIGEYDLRLIIKSL